ncbi:MAG: hypothetical protein ACOC1P_00275 [Minisyncoccales bacterium]
MIDQKEQFLEVELFWDPVEGKEKFEGKARSVSSRNKMGNFDILPQHTNFITLIFDSIIIDTLNQGEIEYEFDRGVLEVSNDKIRIFLQL